jgi:hypothetical protein
MLLLGEAALLAAYTTPSATLGAAEVGVPLLPMLACQRCTSCITFPALIVVSAGL